MKKQIGMDDELRPEYNQSELLAGGVRGKYADRFREGTNLVLLALDVAAMFPDGRAVNEALRLVVQLAQIPQADRQSIAESQAASRPGRARRRLATVRASVHHAGLTLDMLISPMDHLP